MRNPKGGVIFLAWIVLLPAGALASFEGPSSYVSPSLIDVQTISPHEKVVALVSLPSPLSPLDLERISSRGVVILRTFIDFGVVAVEGRADSVVGLSRLPSVQGVYSNDALRFDSLTGPLTTQARASWDSKSTSSPLHDPQGNVVDGRGVGVAIVDSGVDSTHPDLSGAVARNLKYLCTTPGLVRADTQTCFGNTALLGSPCNDPLWIELPNTDTTSGHGTHVAGIVAGRGVASDGRITGVAPGSKVYALGSGEGISILFALEAFTWIHCHFNDVTPKIRVVSNSWGASPGPYDPNNPVNKAVTTLVSQDGLVVVFAAGNDGNAQSTQDRVNPYAKNPTPGVISVGNYDDLGNATIFGSMDPTSSQGSSSGDPSKWPDVAAPGVAIVSTRASTGVVVDALGNPLSGDGRYVCCALSTLDYTPYYVGVSGTSMAAPHVAGIVALLLQSNPALTPALVEDILEDTARPLGTRSCSNPGCVTTYFPDPSNPTTPTNPTAGHGLVDALAALSDPRVGAQGTPTPHPRIPPSAHVYVRVGSVGVDGQVVSGIQWTVPRQASTTLSERFLSSGDSSAFPLSGGQPAFFRVVGPPGTTTLPTTLSPDGVAGTFLMNAPYVFPTPGIYSIEAQIDFGSGPRSFDTFVVRVV